MKGIAALIGLALALALLIGWELVPPRHDDLAPVAGTAPTVSDGAGTPHPSAASAAAPVEDLTALAAKIEARPLFSPARRPPDGTPVATGTGANDVGKKDDLPRLTGVLFGPSGGRAIFAGGDGKSRAAGVGDTVGAFRIQEIAPGIVTLAGAEGERVLHPTYVPATSEPHAAGVPVSSPTPSGQNPFLRQRAGPQPSLGGQPPVSPPPFALPYRARSTR
jgi:hypothetical protein